MGKCPLVSSGLRTSFLVSSPTKHPTMTQIPMPIQFSIDLFLNISKSIVIEDQSKGYVLFFARGCSIHQGFDAEKFCPPVLQSLPGFRQTPLSPYVEIQL